MNSEFQQQMSQMDTDDPAAEKHLRSSVPSAAKEESAPKISVIVPVYKVEKYLPECIESVLAQTFTDFELILVDDGSPDDSGKICDAYAARDPRIRVFHKENGGVSSARNLGLDYARGEWVAFVDSDDWVERDYIDTLLRGLDAADDADFVHCRMRVDSAVFSREVAHGIPGVFPAKAFFLGALDGKGCGGGPYCKLFSKEILEENKIRFEEEISIFEDLLFILRYSKHIRSGVNIPSAPYHYVQHEGSAMHSRSARLSRERVRSMELIEAEIGGNAEARLALNRRKNGVKFAVIRSGTLPRVETLALWRDLPSNGLPRAKRWVMRVHASPIGGLLTPAFALYNAAEKLKAAAFPLVLSCVRAAVAPRGYAMKIVFSLR